MIWLREHESEQMLWRCGWYLRDLNRARSVTPWNRVWWDRRFWQWVAGPFFRLIEVLGLWAVAPCDLYVNGRFQWPPRPPRGIRSRALYITTGIPI